MASHLFAGLTENTMTHGEGWEFARLGRMLERADKTARIIDVKYFILLPSVEYVGMPYDHILWGALLRSASAFEMYRKRYGQIAPDQIIEFLVLDAEFPRAIHHCLIMAERSLRNISGTGRGRFTNPAEKTLGRLLADIDYTQIEEIKAIGLHEFIDGTQTRLNQIGMAVYETFFAIPVDPSGQPDPERGVISPAVTGMMNLPSEPPVIRRVARDCPERHVQPCPFASSCHHITHYRFDRPSTCRRTCCACARLRTRARRSAPTPCASCPGTISSTGSRTPSATTWPGWSSLSRAGS